MSNDGLLWAVIGLVGYIVCLLVCLLLDSTQARKLIAIHSAGNDTEGFAVYIYAEDFDKYCETLTNQCQQSSFVAPAQDPQVEDVIYALPHQDVTLFEMPLLDGEYLHLGETNSYVFRDTKTKIWDSPLALPCEDPNDRMEPAVFDPRDPRMEVRCNPYYEATRKYNRIVS